ncbi:MAG: hypothetical protein P8X63_10945, partial [Desulfuromonadaceae bacterium]
MASKQVLLIDKATQTSLNLLFLLESVGCEVTFIEDADKAFELINELDGHSKVFDLLVLINQPIPDQQIQSIIEGKWCVLPAATLIVTADDHPNCYDALESCILEHLNIRFGTQRS